MQQKGQASIEIIILTVVIIALATFIVLRFAVQQNDVFVTAAARQAFIGEAQKLDETIYLQKVETVECENEYKVVIFAQPEPPDTAIFNGMETRITTEIEETIGNGQEVLVEINPPNLQNLVCNPTP